MLTKCFLMTLSLMAAWQKPEDIDLSSAKTIKPGMVLIDVIAIDENGQALPDAETLLLGFDVVVNDNVFLEGQNEILVHDKLETGVIVNAGPHDALLVFSQGTTVIAVAGDPIKIDKTTCVCRCTCEGLLVRETVEFPCDSNSDKCNYNGNHCEVTRDGLTYIGSFTDCKKVWKITGSK